MDAGTAIMLAALGAALVVLRPRSKPNPTFAELAELIEQINTFEVNHEPTRKVEGADLSVQLADRTLSVIYNRKHGGPVGLEEWVDIYCPGKTGMIFILRNGCITSLEYVGKGGWLGPALHPAEDAALTRFMQHLHKHLQKI